MNRRNQCEKVQDSCLSRRELLRFGSVGLGAWSLPGTLQAETSLDIRSAKKTLPAVKACILLFQTGGPSHLETWDMKPDAPREVRGEFQSIATRVPGLRICEHLPRLAKVADKLAVVRSMHHGMSDHNAAAVEVLCGHTPPEGNIIFWDHANSYPCYGSVLSRLLPAQRHVPMHVALPQVVSRGGKLPGQGPGFLGSRHSPFQVSGDPSLSDFRVEELAMPRGMTSQRLAQRRSLLQQIDTQRKSGRGNDFYERAFTLLRSDAVRRGFDISREDKRARDRYGRNKHGQSVLLARRLVEAGVRFVTVNSIGDPEIGGGDDWDTHDRHFPVLKDDLLPKTDQAFAALVEDLQTRGLLDSTLVVWVGEFGRTPTISEGRIGGAGRDHWANCFSAVLAGGGVKGGTVYGSSDKQGAFPTSDPVSSGDFAATLFWKFGLNPGTTIHDLNGRPVHIGEGKPIRKLFKT